MYDLFSTFIFGNGSAKVIEISQDLSSIQCNISIDYHAYMDNSVLYC